MRRPSRCTRTAGVSFSSSKTEISSSTNSLRLRIDRRVIQHDDAQRGLAISVLISLLSMGPLSDQAARSSSTNCRRSCFGLAERGVEIDGALEVEADVALVGEAHRAVQVHGAPADRDGRIARARLGGQHRQPRRAAVACRRASSTALTTAAQANSASLHMSTSRCWIAWKLAIGLPNCTRSLV